ncbi:hypothetical protein [Nostoc sp.]|uniref:hypothetical protein n=1 Tax=Nostoc sp. TaxID=1180 RepID=UPI002FF5F320
MVHSLLSVNQKVFERRAIACGKSTVRGCQEQVHALQVGGDNTPQVSPNQEFTPT